MRVLNICPTTLNLEIVENIEDYNNLEERRLYWKKKLNAQLEECRAHSYIDGENVIRKRNMECRCSEATSDIPMGDPILLTFD
tara:strand:+ start:1168 stop:1416 length:249 start_codon:yes stop_codon:yes gene_type:complete